MIKIYQKFKKIQNIPKDRDAHETYQSDTYQIIECFKNKKWEETGF